MNKENLNGYAISEECMKWLIDNLPKDSTILEFGSGHGTIELCKHWEVYSIENNKDWLNVADSNYIHSELIDISDERWGNFKWYDIQKLLPKIPNKYDLILLDAPEGNGRRGFLKYLDKFNTNVPIIVDDTHREEERMIATVLGKELNKPVFEYYGHEKTFSVIE